MPPGSSSQDAGRVVPATRQMPVVPPPRAPRPPAPRPGRRPGRGRRLLRTALLLLLAFLVYAVAVPWHAYSSVTRVDSTPSGQRPSAGKGANYLLVGSDSRAGLSAEQEQELATGQTDGNRSDTIMLLHKSESGMSSLVSIPRDSYVEIPGHGRNKINAAFSLGGPQLLAATVENATGLRLDGYLEIGFGGFAGTVDALGGVDICLDAPMKDDMAGIDLPAGCQTLSGPNALGYVRARYSDPRGDIGRAERQRTFLSAVVAKAARPSTVLNPWRYWDFTHAGAAGIKLGEDTSMSETASMLMTMRSVSAGEGLSLVVPIRTTALQTKAGVAVQWDKERALALFDALKKDEPLTGPPAGTDGQPSAG
ncbi:MAG: LCP family protein [Actinobacteria bacterium]|nr:LCP family protein [Actinomycetota bacterium]